MKKTMPFLICIATISVASSFLAVPSVQSRPLSLYLGGGFSDPNGELATSMDGGFYGGAKAGFQIDIRTEFLAALDYQQFSIDKTQFPATDGNFRAILVGFDIKMDMVNHAPHEPIIPFIIAGGGYANIDFTDTLTALPGVSNFRAKSDSKTYVEFGGGFEIGQLFALIRFINIFKEADDARFLSAGIGIKLL